jgi:tetratricopeptide (TPR) repeat protein
MSLELQFGLPNGARNPIFVTSALYSVLSWRLCLSHKIRKKISDYVANRKQIISDYVANRKEIIHTLSQSAKREYHKQNYKGALSIWNYCAIAFGDHSSSAIVAYLLLESRENWKGLGIPQNISLAFEIATKGRAKGSEECASVLALCHLFSTEKTKNKSEIVCGIVSKNDGNLFWQLAYAECLWRGFGSIKQDKDKAKEMLSCLAFKFPYARVKIANTKIEHRKEELLCAIRHGYGEASYELAAHYEHEGLYKKAIEYLIRATTTNHLADRARTDLIKLLYNGKFDRFEELLHLAFGISFPTMTVNAVITILWEVDIKEKKPPPSEKFKRVWKEGSEELNHTKIVPTENLSKYLEGMKKSIEQVFGLYLTPPISLTTDTITIHYKIKHELDTMQKAQARNQSVDMIASYVRCVIQTEYDRFEKDLK